MRFLARVDGFAGRHAAEPAGTARSVRAYGLLPEWLAVPVGHALPTLFVAGVSSAAARGLRIDCGCSGDGGPMANPQHAQEHFRDGALLVLALGLLVLGRSRLAIDPRIPEQPD